MARQSSNKGVKPDETAAMVVEAPTPSATMGITSDYGITTVPFKDGSKMTISIAPDVVRLSFVCHKQGVEKALVLNRTGNAVKTIADLL
jgi:hypothetical protein